GLAIQSDRFWVNLNPKEPDRIADASLANTDVARVLLMADFRMKQEASARTNPQTSPVGREYWRRITEAAGGGKVGEIRQQNRFWIVPGTIVLNGDQNGVYLASATLEVRLESEYFGAHGSRGGSESNAGRDRAEQVVRELVLPYLNE